MASFCDVIEKKRNRFRSEKTIFVAIFLGGCIADDDDLATFGVGEHAYLAPVAGGWALLALALMVVVILTQVFCPLCAEQCTGLAR